MPPLRSRADSAAQASELSPTASKTVSEISSTSRLGHCIGPAYPLPTSGIFVAITVICSTLLVLIPACVAESTFRFGCIFGRFACGAIGTNRLSFRALVHSMIAFRATGGTDIRRVVPLRTCFAFEKCLIAKPTRRALIAPKVGSTRSAVKQRRRNPNGRSHRSRILRRVQLARVATGTLTGLKMF